MDSVYSALAETGLLAAVGLAGAIFLRRDFRIGWFLAALAISLIYAALLTRGFWQLPDPFSASRWNWSGKGLAIAGTLIVMSLPAFGWRRCGMTLDQGAHWRWPLGVLVGLILLILGLSLYFGDGQAASADTIAFQWTMPGFDEELYYRGTLLLALNEAFRPRIRVLGAPIGYGGLLATFAFGLTHALSIRGGEVSFDIMAMAMTGVPALILLWLRERTGSLLMPVIGHNAANGIPVLF